MIKKRMIIGLALLLLAFSSLGALAADNDDPINILMFTKTAGFRHGSIPTAKAVMAEIAEAKGWGLTITEDSTYFTDQNLAQYDVVMFVSTTGSVLDQAYQKKALENFIHNGGGFVGVHAASDTHYDWPWYGELVGAYFNGHPPGTQLATLWIEDHDHPSTAHFGDTFEINDEWYFWDREPRVSAKVLMTLDRQSHPALVGFRGTDPEGDHPITWCKPFEGGRSWYTALGHNDDVYYNEDFQKMLIAGIEWAARRIDGDCHYEIDEIVVEPIITGDVEELLEPIALDFAADGTIFFIERQGYVNMIHPELGRLRLLEIDVFDANEHGLMGIALEPGFDFQEKNHIWLFYSPANAETNHLSRYELKFDDNGIPYIDPNSKELIFEVYTDRATCCHPAGDIRFGPDGTLYIAIGDNTNPHASSGYSPIDRRPGQEYGNAIRSSGNPMDLRGKILRINPDGTIPEDNPFVDDPNVHDAIWSIGHRNPYRIHIDPVTGWVLIGENGPDAGSYNANRGPAGMTSWKLAWEPGLNYGWPFCHGPAIPYVDWDFATNTPGELFDCSEMAPAFVWQTYAQTSQFPELGTGGMSPISGVILRQPAPDAPYQWREHYLNHWYAADFSRHFIVRFHLEEDGTKVPAHSHWYDHDFVPGPDYNNVPRPEGLEIDIFLRGLVAPIDLRQSPDGALYVIAYGSGWFRANTDSGIYRIYNNTKGAPPIAKASATSPWSGYAPLTVHFSAEGSRDVQGEGIVKYEWNFGDGHTAVGKEVSHTYTENGVYQVTVTVTGSFGATSTSEPITVVVGNFAPEPQIESPAVGALFDQRDTVKLVGSAHDEEDGALPASALSWEVIALYSNEDGAQQQTVLTATGAEAEFPMTDGPLNWNSDLVYLVRLTATDSDGYSNTVEQTVRYTRLQAQIADEFAGFFLAPTDDNDGELHAVASRPGDFIAWKDVNMTGRAPVFLRAKAQAGALIELRVDSPTGDLLANASVPAGDNWSTVPLLFDPIEGVHDLYLVVSAIEQGEVAVNYIQVIGR